MFFMPIDHQTIQSLYTVRCILTDGFILIVYLYKFIKFVKFLYYIMILNFLQKAYSCFMWQNQSILITLIISLNVKIYFCCELIGQKYNNYIENAIVKQVCCNGGVLHRILAQNHWNGQVSSSSSNVNLLLIL